MVKWDELISKVCIWNLNLIFIIKNSLTAHEIDNNFLRKSYVLAITNFEGNQTSEKSAFNFGQMENPFKQMACIHNRRSTQFQKSIFFKYFFKMNIFKRIFQWKI